MTINLAPNHKMGLPVPNPVLLAAGTIAYGEALHRGLDPSVLGGAVVGPITRYSQAGTERPRLAETNGGFVLETGLQNRGISAVLKRFVRYWPRLGCPVVAQIADTRADAAATVAERLMGARDLMGLELLVAPQATPEAADDLVRTIVRHSDLPLWVKLPLDQAVDLAPGIVAAGAAGLVVGQPLRGAAIRPAPFPVPVTGAVYGPLAFAPMLAVLLDVARLDLPVALIACGGIHTAGQARQALAAGADAFQIDSAVWIEPGLPGRLVGALSR